jgi:type I restriction enzyme S subunit
VNRRKPVEYAETPRRFNRYPAYKDTGIKWLGEIPTHWGVKRLKYLAIMNPETLTEETDPALEISYVDIGGVDSLGRIVERERMIFGSSPSRARRLVRAGDVIVSTVRTYLRAIAVVSESQPGMVVSTGFAVVRPGAALTTEYAAYALRAPYFVERVVANSTGVSFPAINESEMATYELAAPPESEQRAIATFLDRETARIDGLVAKKEQLIELLQEQRVALITHAVTKGLDPKAPMKDSGVDWLGEIPAHWEVKRLKNLVPGVTVGIVVTPSKYYVDDGVPCLRSLNIAQGVVTMADVVFISSSANELHRKSKIFTGDVLVVRTGKAGTAVVVPQELDGSNCIDLLIIRRSKLVDSRFLYHFVNSLATLRQVEARSVGAIQEHYNTGTLAELWLPEVPLPEQREIAAFLDRETARIDTLIAKVRDALDGLKEFRTALISAAVTGKIDVREAA